MRRVLSLAAFAFLIVLLLAAPALAVFAMTIGPQARVHPPARHVVQVQVSVGCHSDDASGTTTLSVSQDQRDGTVTGTGSASVICDGVVRDYLVDVTATTGVFVRGAAVATGETTFPETLCIEHPELGRECETHTMHMIADPTSITISYGH